MTMNEKIKAKIVEYVKRKDPILDNLSISSAAAEIVQCATGIYYTRNEYIKRSLEADLEMQFLKIASILGYTLTKKEDDNG